MRVEAQKSFLNLIKKLCVGKKFIPIGLVSGCTNTMIYGHIWMDRVYVKLFVSSCGCEIVCCMWVFGTHTAWIEKGVWHTHSMHRELILVSLQVQN